MQKEVKKMPVIDMTATGENIQNLRKGAGLTVREMQSLLGFTTVNAIYKWFHGESLPSVDNLVILAKILNVTMDDIIITK